MYEKDTATRNRFEILRGGLVQSRSKSRPFVDLWRTYAVPDREIEATFSAKTDKRFGGNRTRKSRSAFGLATAFPWPVSAGWN